MPTTCRSPRLAFDGRFIAFLSLGFPVSPRNQICRQSSTGLVRGHDAPSDAGARLLRLLGWPKAPGEQRPFANPNRNINQLRQTCRPIPISAWLLALGVQEPKTGREGQLIRRTRRRSRCISGSRRRTEPFRLLLLRWRPPE